MPHRGKKVRRRKVIKSKTQPSSAPKFKAKKDNITLKELKASKESQDFIPLSTIGNKVPKKIKDEPIEKEVEENDAVRPRSKSGRIIIRNLPFKVTEENLREHLKSYGTIEEVNLLYKPDGKLVGCGFVQFSSKSSAAKAIEDCNAKPFLGRIIILDWAVPKDVFKKKYHPPNHDSNEIGVKSEADEVDEQESEVVPQDEVFDVHDSDEGEEEDQGDEDDQSDHGELEEDSEEELDEKPRGKGSQKSRKFEEEEEPPKRPPPNVLDRDCTVFLRNVSFQTTSEELKEFMEKFGPVTYALICVDRVTDHSKGTAFVKFKNSEGAKACLAADSDELTLDCSKIVAAPAVSREEARQKIDEQKQKTPKDGRNLYLVKEGVITAGSKSANGVSVSDMTKRVKLDEWKTNMLRNLNMFVSRYRLAVHNLPMEFSDRQLRRLFQKNSDREAVIKEARIMRNLKVVDADGVGQSKGYGFVSFTKHEHALQALRNINNNPDIFTSEQRPIVAFSIENRAILNARHKRLLKSQAMNPLYQGSAKKLSSGKGGAEKGGRGRKNFQGATAEEQADEMVPKYGGLTGKPGVSSLRSKKKLQGQLKTHVENVKKNKQKKKKAQLQQPKLRKVSDARSQPSLEKKLKRKLSTGDEAFTQLVKKYKQQLTSNVQKWYE
ncbi:RNA-binding protein 28 [Ischnura elegans]|uniref:RNA-binding protein 28 n=1 Tax=Ischnura elegans TaxID=197161 RepID=UPI001ED871DF|nr:RNA-binding protein 28 [Ischnura elegans]